MFVSDRGPGTWPYLLNNRAQEHLPGSEDSWPHPRGRHVGKKGVIL